MKNMKKLQLLMSVLVLLTACEQSSVDDVPNGGRVIQVSIESVDTRIQIVEKTLVWTKGDNVSVYYQSDNNEQWQFSGETGDTDGCIHPVNEKNIYSTTNEDVVILYPYRSDYVYDHESLSIKTTIPSTQHYRGDAPGEDGSIMVSTCDSNKATMKSVNGWVRLSVFGKGEVVKSITMRGNNGEFLSGLVSINAETADASWSLEHDMVNDTNSVTTLICDDGVKLGDECKTFYISVLPQIFHEGVTVEIKSADGKSSVIKISSEIVVQRNAITAVACGTFKYDDPATHELIYVTNDGQPLDPYVTAGFGATFIEEIYDLETGSGVLKFDAAVTRIPNEAFSSCTNLTAINLPTTIKYIGDESFLNCKNLEEITIHAGVITVGTDAFKGCRAKALIECSNACFKNAGFTEVIIGDNVLFLGDYAFNSCPYMERVTLGAKVVRIGWSAFEKCDKLRNVFIKDIDAWNNIKFDSYASPLINGANLYVNGKLFEEWVVPNSMTEVYDVFRNCQSIKKVVLHDKVTSIAHAAFQNCANLESINIPNSVTSMGNGTFENCVSLKSIVIGNHVEKVCLSTFRNCTSLTDVTIGSRVTSIGFEAFYGCEKLQNLTMGKRVESIGESAFYNCYELKKVVIPSGVTTIGKYAFYNCRSLRHIDCQADTPPQIEKYSYPFYVKGIVQPYISVPRDSYSKYLEEANWRPYRGNILKDCDRSSYKVGDIVTYNGVDGVVVHASDEVVKLISVKSFIPYWSKDQNRVNTDDGYNGRTNYFKVKDESYFESLYAISLCSSLAAEWYLPAIYELTAIRDIKDTVNSVLSGNGHSPLSDVYWSSTEYDQYSAKTYNFTDGMSLARTKNFSQERVRAMVAF